MIIFESEKELEDLLCKELEDNAYWVVEDEHVDQWQRQTNLGYHGITDIITSAITMDLDENKVPFISSRTLKVIELKITELSYTHLSQIARYKDFFDMMEPSADMDYVLVCKHGNLASDAFYLAQSLDWLSVYLYDLSITKGLVFTPLNSFSANYDTEKMDSAIDRVQNHFFDGEKYIGEK